MDYNKPNPKLYDVPFTTDTFNDMPYNLLGKSGLRVSKVGLGTWKIGYPKTNDGSRVDEMEAFEIFDKAIEKGVTFWDTANRYSAASGNSERIIGKWLKKNSDQRRNIVLATKMFGGMDGFTPNHSRLSRINIIESVYASLERLDTDSIDLLYFHRHEGQTPIEESLEAIEDLIKQDLIRYLGVSNFSIEQLEQYQKTSNTLSNRTKVIAVQNKLNILEGENQEHQGVLNHCAQNQMGFIPYSPLAKGLLTHRYIDLDKVGKGDRLYDEKALDAAVDEKTHEKMKKLYGLANDWDVTLSELALAYTLTLEGVASVIPSASNSEQLESNAKAGTIMLTQEQKEKIKQIVGM